MHLEALKLKGKTADEIIKELGKLTPYKDFQKMFNFENEVNFDNVPYEAKKEYVDMFLNQLEKNKIKQGFEKEELIYPTDPDKFLKFWANIFRKNAKTLFEKSTNIVRHISSKGQINEQYVWPDTDFSDESIKILYGIDLNSSEL